MLKIEEVMESFPNKLEPMFEVPDGIVEEFEALNVENLHISGNAMRSMMRFWYGDIGYDPKREDYFIYTGIIAQSHTENEGSLTGRVSTSTEETKQVIYLKGNKNA